MIKSQSMEYLEFASVVFGFGIHWRHQEEEQTRHQANSLHNKRIGNRSKWASFFFGVAVYLLPDPKVRKRRR